jgi:deoxyuridine 5'-triphosphate nucleotidohydrolase
MKVCRLTEESKLPTKKYVGDVGFDLYSTIDVVIEPHTTAIIPTGIAIELPSGFFGWITNKSSKEYLVGAGIVDNNYRGEIKVRIFNVLNKKIYIKEGDAIAQLILLPQISDTIELVLFLSETGRNNDGGINR